MLFVIPSKSDLQIDSLDWSILGSALRKVLFKNVDTFYDKYFDTCLSLSDIILDRTWEKLNTGHWKDVDISWRYLYSYASLLKAMSLLRTMQFDTGKIYIVIS